MRTWKALGVGMIVLAVLTVAGGAWSTTMEDVNKEVAKMKPEGLVHTTYRTSAPMIMSGGTAVSFSEVCVKGDMVHRKATGEALGKAAPNNEYDIVITENYAIPGGPSDAFIRGSRHVSLPPCQ